MNRLLSALVLLSILTRCAAQGSLQKLYPVNFSKVEITDAFWKPRMQTVANSTLQVCINYTENKTGRIRNFEKAARGQGEKHEGIYYDDSDVYKAIEAIAYSLKNYPDPALEKKADDWIAKIAAAQLPDGYVNTYYSLKGLDGRWTDMEKHEDYNAGHLIEAAIAYYNTTGKKTLLDVATRFANHIDSTFRMNNRHWVSGHQEIELALMKLFHQTQNNRYLQLAQWFLDQRGHGYGKGVIWDDWKDPAYCQDNVPVKEQKEITGHAVRAMYLYTGAADVAAVTKDIGYIDAMKHIWEDVVYRNMYITGGIGAQGKNEGFGVDYDLPNETAYCETCASVGMVIWNQRMHMLSGEGKYIDILERSLYNGALDGLSLSGDHFFYGNPLASTGTHKRSEWFGTACCPSNIARLVASLGNYIYSTSPGAVWVNLFIGSKTTLQMGKTNVDIGLETNSPWGGSSSIKVDPSSPVKFALKVRIPGWLKEPVPGDLYRYETLKLLEPVLTVNDKPAAYAIEAGYAVIDRTWKQGDVVRVGLPMEVSRIISRPDLKQNTDRVALQYGPMVYCVEGIDNGGKCWNIILPGDASFVPSFDKNLLGGVNTISFNGIVAEVGEDGKSLQSVRKQIKAIPYFSWNNRGPGPMQVWLPVAFKDVKVNY
ncbi:MAG: beta-L-arabinofuranosidase domain-containing protein [Chitinophagaceae bacterium]